MAGVDNRAPFFRAFGFYVSWMLAIALLSYSRNKTQNISKEAEYRWHFLSGKGYGSIIVFLTLFSTVYGGYTIVGVPNEASNLGYFLQLGGSQALQWSELHRFCLHPALADFLLCVTTTPKMISSRIDSTIDSSQLSSLLLTIPQVLYIVAQDVHVEAFVPILANGMIDGNITTWFLAAVI